MNNGCWPGRSTGCRDSDLRRCILVCFVGIRLVVSFVELAVAVIELKASDATVDPSHVGHLVHRQVEQIYYCCDRVVKWTAHLMNAVEVV